KVTDLRGIPVSEVMQRQMVSVQASMNLNEFAGMLSPHSRHEAFPVFDGDELLGAVALWSMIRIPPERWQKTTVGDLIDHSIQMVDQDCDVSEAARLLLSEHKQPMLLVVSHDGHIKGIVTKTDILQTLKLRREIPLELTAAAIE
ncbi:MAG: CBS domain-containing protein, partial [Acidobacteriaceae bacterium]